MRAVLTVGLGLALCAALGATPASAATGSIAGTVTDAGSHEGIAGIWVCAHSPNFGVTGGCAGTDSAGNYTIPNLQPNVYRVGFEEEGRRNYLAQWYPGKAIVEEAQFVQVQSATETPGIDATLTVGAQISGTVTDVEGGAPIEGIRVCAPQIDPPTELGVIHCDKTDSAGNYMVWALPTGQFKLEFGPAIFQAGAPNYIHQYYPGKSTWAEAEVRAVTAGATYAGVDASLQRGVGIAGTVTEAGGGPVTGGPRICALNATSEEIVQCTGVEIDGTYWMPGLPFGSYVVSFAVDVEEGSGLILHPDGFVRQYYDGKPAFAEADVLASASPMVFTGIDAQLVRGPEIFPAKPGPPQLTPPPSVTFPTDTVLKSTKCRKGSRKKWVRGQRRCVKKPRKHRRHRHHRRHHHRHGQAAGR